MLAHFARQRRGLQQLVPLASSYAMLLQSRGASMRIFEVFSKEKREERKKKLKEEMERGYFDDFRDFRDRKGKIFLASDRLIPASQARAFPPIQALLPDGSQVPFPPPAAAGAGGDSGSASGGPESTLVCIAFRAGAQEMLEAWAVPFSERFAGRPGLCITELSLVEQVVMRVWPFKGAILRGGSRGGGRYQLPARFLFYFGGTEELRERLFMTNRLTGYVYLVDSAGRVRWRGSGSPDQTELQDLLRCGEDLLKEQRAGNGGSGGASNAASSRGGGSNCESGGAGSGAA